MSQSEGSIASGFRCINPDEPVELAGFPGRPVPHRGIHSDLEVNAISLRQDSEQAVVVQLDVLSVGERFRRDLLQALAGKVQSRQLLLCASHTHFAPNLDWQLERLGAVNARYYSNTLQTTVELIEALLASTGKRVRLSFQSGWFGAIVNRRKIAWQPVRRPPFIVRGPMTLPNRAGACDHSVRVISFSSGAATDAILWNFACHPVGLPLLDQGSSEFPGKVRTDLRRHYGADLAVAFLPGFMGDVRPAVIDSGWGWCRTIGQYLHRLFEGPRFRSFTLAEWDAWSDQLSAVVTSTAARSATPDQALKLTTRREEIPLETAIDCPDPKRTLSVQRLDINAGLSLCATSAEVLSSYLAVLRRVPFPGCLLPVAYIDGVAGYLPDAKATTEGGYEVDGSRFFFGLEANTSPRIEHLVFDLWHRAYSGNQEACCEPPRP